MTMPEKFNPPALDFVANFKQETVDFLAHDLMERREKYVMEDDDLYSFLENCSVVSELSKKTRVGELVHHGGKKYADEDVGKIVRMEKLMRYELQTNVGAVNGSILHMDFSKIHAFLSGHKVCRGNCELKEQVIQMCLEHDMSSCLLSRATVKTIEQAREKVKAAHKLAGWLYFTFYNIAVKYIMDSEEESVADHSRLYFNEMTLSTFNMLAMFIVAYSLAGTLKQASPVSCANPAKFNKEFQVDLCLNSPFMITKQFMECSRDIVMKGKSLK